MTWIAKGADGQLPPTERGTAACVYVSGQSKPAVSLDVRSL